MLRSRRIIVAMLVASCVLPAGAINYSTGGNEVYVPDNLAPGEKIRGYMYSTFDGWKRWVDSPIMRDFANRTKIVIGCKTTDYAALGRTIGHPELANIPIIRFGHSAGGFSLWNEAVEAANVARSLAVIAQHGRYHWWMFTRDSLPPQPNDPRGKLPVFTTGADRDWVDENRGLVMFKSAGIAADSEWVWTGAIDLGTTHMGENLEEMRLMTYWLEDVAALRIPTTIPDDGRVTLRDINLSSGWIVYAEYEPTTNKRTASDRVVNAACYSYAQAPRTGGTVNLGARTGVYSWAPSERFARMWVNYHNTGNCNGTRDVLISRAWNSLNDGIAGTWQGEENMAPAGWNSPGFVIHNLPNWNGRYADVRWRVISGQLPPGIAVDTCGNITGTATTAGLYKITLQATYNSVSYQTVRHWPLRASNATNTLKITIGAPANLSTVSLPASVSWSSDQPLGQMEWHSSLDGDLGAADGSLETSGTIRLTNLQSGLHTFTIHAYSSTTFHREAQTVCFTVEGGVDVDPPSAKRAIPAVGDRNRVAAAYMLNGRPLNVMSGARATAPGIVNAGFARGAYVVLDRGGTRSVAVEVDGAR